MQGGHAYCIHGKTTALHKLSDTAGRLSFVNWYLRGVHDGETVPTIIVSYMKIVGTPLLSE
jgi:hypothetical protein